MSSINCRNQPSPVMIGFMDVYGSGWIPHETRNDLQKYRETLQLPCFWHISVPNRQKKQPFVSYRLDPSLWDRDWIKMIEPSMSRQSVVQGTEALSLSQWQHLAGEVVQLVHSTHLKWCTGLSSRPTCCQPPTSNKSHLNHLHVVLPKWLFWDCPEC